jgi:hypothetical protein
MRLLREWIKIVITPSLFHKRRLRVHEVHAEVREILGKRMIITYDDATSIFQRLCEAETGLHSRSSCPREVITLLENICLQ